MKYGKYRERDRSAALKKVRADLGPNAVILHEQRVRTGLFGLFGKPLVEILAAVEEHDAPPAAPVSSPGSRGDAGARWTVPGPAAGSGTGSGTGGVQSFISVAARRAAEGAAGAAPSPEPPPPAPHSQPPRWSVPGLSSGPTPEGASRLAAILEEFPKKGEQIPPAMAASLAELIAQAAVPDKGPEARAEGQGEIVQPGAARTRAAAETAERGGAPPEAPPSPHEAAAPREQDASVVNPAPRPAGAADTLPSATSPPDPVPLAPLAPPPPDSSPVLRDVQQTLVELRSAVDRLARQSQDSQVANEVPAVRAVYQQLMAQEVEPTLALEVVGQLSEEIGPDHDPGVPLVRGRLLEMLEERLPVAGLEPGDGRPRVVVLVGPTGVGKTTTLAKLAAHLALDEGKQVCLVTTDTFRIAATGQLGTYAGIMDLPLEVVYTPEEFAAAIARHADADFILVDTPGCAPRNRTQIQELERFVAATPEALTLLTVAAQTKFRDLVEIYVGFGVVAQGGMILTKLDETSAHGPVLSLVARAAKPVYFATAGQNVPSDIEAPTAARLAGILLDGLSHGDAAGAPEVAEVAAPAVDSSDTGSAVEVSAAGAAGAGAPPAALPDAVEDQGKDEAGCSAEEAA